MVRTYQKTNASSLGMFDEPTPRRKKSEDNAVSSPSHDLPYPPSPLSKWCSNDDDLISRDPPTSGGFVVPSPIEVGLCPNCKRLFQATHERNRSVDYDDILNQKRLEEKGYRNTDPFIGGMKASSSEGYLNQYSNYQDYNLGDGVSELSGTLARLQNAATGLGDSGRHHGGQRETWSPENNSRERWRKEPGTKSGYRRDGEIRDPLQHLHGNNSGGRRSDGGYSPSVYDRGGPKNGRRGGNAAPPGATDRETYQRELQQQMADQAARREWEKKHENMDWWEKKPAYEPPPPPPQVTKKPHISQRSDSHPRNDRRSYEDDLRSQMEAKKREMDDAKRREREEDDRIERRIQEQQARMKSEFDEEQSKKRAKEEAKIRRQEELARKQQEMQEEVERSRKEASERKMADRRRVAKQATRRGDSAGDRSSPPPPEQYFRSDSPPIPSLRGKKQDNEVVNQLSNMRQQLDRAQEEHNAVWNGLVEV